MEIFYHNYKFLDFKFYHYIHFYLFSSIQKKDDFLKMHFIIEELKQSFIKIFKINQNDYIYLFDNFLCKNKLNIENNNNNDYIEKSCDEEETSNYDIDFFRLRIIPKNKSIILIGPSSYRVDLIKNFLMTNNNFKIIYCNIKSSVDNLLGIDSSNNELNDYEISYDKFDLNKLIELSKHYNTINEIINNTLKESFIDNKKTIMIKKNTILWYILRFEPIIFKNIHQLPRNNYDSLKKLIYFNKWFDYHFSYSINFFGICPENTLKQIPKSILTQFFILSVGEHEFKKVIQIIKSHSELNENLINNIISLYKT